MRSVPAILLVLLATHMASATDAPSTSDFSTASNAFASDLYGQIRAHDGNQCVSPYSVSTALAMTVAGARGKTATQILAVLHWTLPADQLSVAVATLTGLITPARDDSKATTRGHREPPIVRVCNSLWGATGLNYEPSFQSLLKIDFGAELHPVDFRTDPDLARSQINAWASDATNKRILQALPANSIHTATRLVLVNAVYFKAAWMTEFNATATKDQPFHLDDGSTATAPLMHRHAHLGYAENDQLQAVEVPYSGGFSMVILLPKKIDGLQEMESTFSGDSLKALSSTSRLVDLYLPRFKMNCQYDLTGSLASMGMKDACSSTADFSGITASERLMIDAVSHSTFIAVDEQGTEAAAITAVTMAPTAMRMRPEEPVIFRADRPFLFVIRQDQTGAILFMGRVADPT